MSGPDLAARGLARQALMSQPALFSAMQGRAIPASLNRLESTGYSVEGMGAGTYVHDAQCTASLLGTHPRFAFRSADNRIFRLLAQGSAIYVEQAGARGIAGQNDQPAIQAAIDYAQAVAVAEVRFGQGRYELWAPFRSSPFKANFAIDGHYIVISKTLVLRGVAATRTVLDCRALGGGDPQTSWQTVWLDSNDPSPRLWRGNACLLRGNKNNELPAPGNPLEIDRVELHRLVFRGNTVRTANHDWPANITTGDGWDGTHQGLKVHDTHVGDIVLRDTDFVGWRGELLYLAGYDARSLTMDRVRLLTTNGNAMNPGTNTPIIANNCEFGDAYQAHEDTGKRYARYSGCIWRDADKMNIGSGPTNGQLYNYLYPTRDTATQPPVTQFDGCEIRNVGMAYIGNWVRGRLRTTDSIINLTANLFFMLQDIDLDIEALIDQKDAINPLLLYGPDTLTKPVSGAPAGIYIQPPRNVHVRLRHIRTAAAQAAGRNWAPFRWSGYIDKSCRVTIDGSEATTVPNTMDNPTKSAPFVELGSFSHSLGYLQHGAANVGPFNQNGEIRIAAPVVQAHSTVDGLYDATLAAVPTGGSAYGFAEGQRLRIYKSGDLADVRFVKGQSANVSVQRTRVLDKHGDWIDFAFNSSAARWEECGFFSAASETLSASFAARSVPAVNPGSTTTLSVTIAGAKVGDKASASFAAALPGLLLFAETAAADSVKVSLFNPGTQASAAFTSDLFVDVSRR